MGNICRSPTAEGVFRHHAELAGMAERLHIDSAGTHAYHVGEPADRRARAAAERRGMSLDGIRARRVSVEDFERFDYIIAMDEDNLARLRDEAPEEHQHKLRLFLEYSGGPEREVPDPYYGGSAGFERVLDLVEAASRGLLERLSRD
jgi:protein-tyrosine phosphatase